MAIEVDAMRLLLGKPPACSIKARRRRRVRARQALRQNAALKITDNAVQVLVDTATYATIPSSCGCATRAASRRSKYGDRLTLLPAEVEMIDFELSRTSRTPAR